MSGRLLSLTVPSSSDHARLVDLAATDTRDTKLTCWHNPQWIEAEHATPYTHTSSPEGAALLCGNGTLLLFHSRPRPTALTESSLVSTSSLVDRLGNSRSSSPLRNTGLDIAYPRSPSSARNSFGSSGLRLSKPRVVSGVTTDQAEAPKTYVDYDDEPGKLKDMLKGKSRKERLSADPYMSAEREPEVTSKKKQRSENKSGALLPASLSPGSSSRSSPSPSPPTFSYQHGFQHSDKLHSQSWSLISHVFPPRIGNGQCIASTQPIPGGHYLIALRVSGRMDILSIADGSFICSFEIGNLPEAKGSSPAIALWTWKSIQVLVMTRRCIVLATAVSEVAVSSLTVDATESNDNLSRVAAIELHIPSEAYCDDFTFIKVSDLTIMAFPESISWHLSNGYPELLYITTGNRLVKRRLVQVEQSAVLADREKSSSNVHLPLPNPFKAFVSHSTENITDDTTTEHEKQGFDDEIDISNVLIDDPVCGIRLRQTLDGWRALVWTPTQLLGLEFARESFRYLFVYPMNAARDVQWDSSESFTVLLKDHAESYKLLGVDQNNDPVPTDAPLSSARRIQPHMTYSCTLLPSDAYAIMPDGHILSTRVKRGRRRLEYTTLDRITGKALSHTLWNASDRIDTAPRTPHVTAMLPFELTDIILGYSDGIVRRSSLDSLLRSGEIDNNKFRSDLPVPGGVLNLHLVKNERTGGRLLVGGADDGGIAVWELDTLRLLARWTVFIHPLINVLPLQAEGRLKGCMFCVSEDGTIAVIALDDYQFLYLIPPATSALTKVCLGDDNLLLYYTDSRARLWDVKTREFWRSLSSSKANELIGEGVWSEWAILDGHRPLGASAKEFISPLPNPCRTKDGEATLLIDIEGFLLQAGLNAAPIGAKGVGISAHSLQYKSEDVRTILSALLTPGLDANIDRICTDVLGIPKVTANVGWSIRGVTSLYADPNARAVWSISPDYSAARAATIVALLNTMLQYEDVPSDIETIVAFYTASLGQLVGDSYQPPSLPLLARLWLETPANALRHAAYLLFEAGVAGLSDEEITKLVDAWQPYLPSRQAEQYRQKLQNAISLYICGHVAVSRYTLLPPSQLTEFAKSIALYLHDEKSPYRAQAIDLVSRGFSVWQQYVDAVDMLRALFALATSTRKDTITVQNVSQLARSAVLQIASTNTPLFMTTLSMDILQPRNVQHRKSIMQLVIFLIRKSPLILYSNLPRLVEAVVKSLDPNSTASREAVLDTATEILGHVVQSFPVVDFHMPSQRLAVGTSEGALIMYDLKTATRLYVLEGHKKRTTACSFSPDGRRLVTVSLEESVVLVWKVGTSFSSFFNPGAPPRQGHGGSEPFKTLNFAVGEDAHMSILETFELVRLEWPADRTVRLHIRDAIFTFST